MGLRPACGHDKLRSMQGIVPGPNGQPRRFAIVTIAALACAFTGNLARAQTVDLITAAGAGDLPAVRALLAAGANVNDSKNTVSGSVAALMEAAGNGHLQVVQALIEANANVNATRGVDSTDGDTALAIAVRNGHLNVVQALLAAKADVNAGSVPPLYIAAMTENLEVVRALLAAKPDLDWRDPRFGTNALMQAIAPFRLNSTMPLQLSESRWGVARMLVEAGANANAISKLGVTPLMLAAEDNTPDGLSMVQTLLAAHADINGAASASPRQGLTLAPVPIGANPSSYSRGGYTPLGLAASAGNEAVVRALLDANEQRAARPSVAVNAKQPAGNTPLTMASAKGNPAVVRALLAADADVTAADAQGKTALALALENGHAEVAELLRSAASRPVQR